MRILTIHNRYQQAGGEDLVFEEESRLLRDMGHQVKQLVFENADISSTSTRLVAALTLIYNPMSASRLKKILHAFRPHIIHVHNFFPLASPSIFFAARTFRVPVVVTLHNYRLICPSASLFHDQKVYERSLRSIFPWHAIMIGVYRHSRAMTAASAVCFALHNVTGTWKRNIDRFIVLSEFAKRKLESSRLRIDFSKLTVKPNFVYDQGCAQEVRKNFYLYVGRLSPEKGTPMLLSAAKAHCIELVVVGDGPLRALVLKYASECPNITYLGYQAKESVFKLMRTCKALIFPSLCYESFGMAIVEAFSTGTPVVASRLGSIVTIVEEGMNGLLFKAGDEEDLVRTIKKLDGNPVLAATLGINARKTYLRKYTPEINYHMLMEIYNKAILEAQSKTSAEMPLQITDDVSESQPGQSLLPRLTIGMPTCNGGARIQRALDSIFLQKYDNLEIIISDNASTDDTPEVCAHNISSHPEITYFRQTKNIGLVPNFDFVRSKARGKYFMWLSDDDVLAPGILAQCVFFLEKNPDFSIAAGQIVYREGDRIDYIEGGFNLTGNISILRLIRYYYKTVYGGMFHGVMRRELAAQVPVRKVFGNDFHFVAGLAYLGKIHNFDFPGYYKSLGGCSKDVHQCARSMGESPLASRFPHLKIAVDAFAEVMYRSPLYSMRLPVRFVVAVMCFLASFIGYHGRILPLTLAGIIKRYVFRVFRIQSRGSYFKRASFRRNKIDHRKGTINTTPI